MKVHYKKSFFESLWRISFKKAFILSLPLLFSIGLIISGASLNYNQLLKTSVHKSLVACLFDWPRGMPKPNRSISHLYLHDQMQRIFNYLTARRMPSHDEVPIFSLSIDPTYFKALNSNLPTSGKETSYPATLVSKDGVYSCQARYRGEGYWHWNRKQKSWRLNLGKGQMINRATRINLINPKTILSFNEITSMHLAKQAGLLAPRCLPVKFVQNRQYMGFYDYLEQVDEYFIRRHKKIPGRIYDGDHGGFDKVTGAPTLWNDQRYWTQVYTDFADDRDDITELIDVLNDPCLNRFYDFSKNHLDIETYCSYASFDSIVGCFHHTFNQNNKLAFDPITGRFIAIPWDIHIWTPSMVPDHDYDPSANALLFKWKLVPLFEYERQKRLWKLINGPLSKEKILARLEKDYKIACPVIKSDKYRDGSFGDTFNTLKVPQIAVRPFSMKKFNETYEKYRDTVIKRNEFLRKYLSDSTAEFAVVRKGNLSQLIIQASGTVGVKLQEINLNADAGTLKIYKDTNRDGILDENDEFMGSVEPSNNSSFELDEVIFPGFKLVKHNLSPYQYGTHSLVPSNLLYSFLITGGAVNDIELIAENPVTGEPVAITHVKQIDYSKAQETASIHPWDIPKPPASESMVIGPGTVSVSETTIYPENLELTILPGTELLLSRGASLIFRGKVIAQGTEEKPIMITSSEASRPWGTFALQGKNTTGSIFEHCLWTNGSKAKVDLIHYPAMLSIHDTKDVIVRNCVFTNNHDGSSGLRVGYGKNVLIEECLFTDLKDTAINIDASEAKIISCGFRRCEGNAVDLVMSSSLIDKCLFKNVTSKAVLCREDSSVQINSSIFFDSTICIEAQDASDIRLEKTSFYKSATAINITKGIYPENPTLTSDEIFVNSCNQIVAENIVSQVNIKKVTNTSLREDLLTFVPAEKLQIILNKL